ncbi:MotA/TolQ/ExbB proton channel family protein [Pelagicoccus sp. SDUM812003]|uniref:MotA/TolQ/ExbB proton channel family protein n=1 Tax=Pelagicoccus sp. SDUM812003 TaxID=3041267 RepID=UPI00280E083B|nr:MotA/TolQ/ExbB proton channel family protein [Pelagicoccus sp. SDUM812003]MDQ8202302.1 MotA/TolQ/ExbB proton channel family protein [Pelagicoccus sp. SDUM812003]
MSAGILERIWQIIYSGGPIMVALALLAFMLYRNTVGVFLFITRLRVRQTLQRHHSKPTRTDIRNFREHFEQLVRTQLKYANVLIVAAPLMGLLGTVAGMLDTFRGIGAESGQDTTKAVADGIKVALITTQTGLMIAIIGLFFSQWILRIYRSKDLQLLELELETMEKT